MSNIENVTTGLAGGPPHCNIYIGREWEQMIGDIMSVIRETLVMEKITIQYSTGAVPATMFIKRLMYTVIFMILCWVIEHEVLVASSTLQMRSQRRAIPQPRLGMQHGQRLEKETR